MITFSSIKYYFKSCMWLMPFISFVLGYNIVSFFIKKEIILTPNLVGIHIYDAIKQLSAQKINVRILNEKEDENIQEGIIISQSPKDGQKIKAHQSIYLVVTRKPKKTVAPQFIGLDGHQAYELAKEKKISLRTYTFQSDYPVNKCIAQNFIPGFELDMAKMLIYVSAGPTRICIFPNFIDLLLKDVIDILNNYKLSYKITNLKNAKFGDSLNDPQNTQNGLRIIEQRPLAGSIVNLDKLFTVQLLVS